MNKSGIRVQNISSIIETDPVGGPPQGKFLNAVAECETALTPIELLKTLQNIERNLGRVKAVQDGPREIDLDILVYDRVRIEIQGLTIPHPKMRFRDFVMVPLREIAPHIVKDLEQCVS